MDETRKIFSHNLQVLIKNHNVVQKDLAKFCGVYPSAITSWCAGLSFPRADKLDKIALFFGVPVAALTDGKHNGLQMGVTNSPEYVAFYGPAETLPTDAEDLALFNAVKSAIASTQKVSKEEYNMILEYRKLSDEDKTYLRQTLTRLLRYYDGLHEGR